MHVERSRARRGGGWGRRRWRGTGGKGRGRLWNPSRKMPRDFRRGFLAMHRVIQPAIFLAKLLPPRFISPFDRRIHSRYRSIAFLSPLSPPLFTFSFFLFNFALSLCFIFFFFLFSFSLPLSYFLRGNRPSSCSFSSSSPPFLLSSTVSLLLSRAAERRTHTVVLLTRTWRVLFVGII